MNDTTKNALAVIERILLSEGASQKTAHAATHACYQLGRMDGQMEVSAIVASSMEALKVAA